MSHSHATRIFAPSLLRTQGCPECVREFAEAEGGSVAGPEAHVCDVAQHCVERAEEAACNSETWAQLNNSQTCRNTATGHHAGVVQRLPNSHLKCLKKGQNL